MADNPLLPGAIVFAGIPAVNNALYHRLRFRVGDPAALIEIAGPPAKRILILRDIEMVRAREQARVDEVACPADFAPEGGLSGDRETATAQSVAECLIRHGVKKIVADRSLPFLYADEMQSRGLRLECDRELGVVDRRSKDDEEVEWLRRAQSVTEGAIEVACRLIAKSSASKDGTLMHEGSALTSERVRTAVDIWLLERGFASVTWIVAGGGEGADCHNVGHGPLRTAQPIIVDIFPKDRSTGYNGDCTRTVVHGEIPKKVEEMHRAVVLAKQSAVDACRAGVTGQSVHEAATSIIQQKGYSLGLPEADSGSDYCGMTHGTGHGIGLDVHEPPLLDKGGPVLLVGDALTIEPGLYCASIGGLRIEDMVIVGEDGCENLNRLPEGLTWN